MKLNEEIWNQPVPQNIKLNFIRTKPSNRKEWASQIYSVIMAIEGSTCSWDEWTLKILDDAYDYCDAYNLTKMRNKIKNLHTNFFAGKAMVIDMNALRGFFHDEWFNPTSDSRLTVEDRYELLARCKR